MELLRTLFGKMIRRGFRGDYHVLLHTLGIQREEKAKKKWEAKYGSKTEEKLTPNPNCGEKRNEYLFRRGRKKYLEKRKKVDPSQRRGFENKSSVEIGKEWKKNPIFGEEYYGKVNTTKRYVEKIDKEHLPFRSRGDKDYQRPPPYLRKEDTFFMVSGLNSIDSIK